jgi:hypothetical protein
MNDKLDPGTERLGLLANGASRRWEIAVDEVIDRNEWSLELDGPQAYLVFQIQTLDVIPGALDFLQAGLHTKQVEGRYERRDNEAALTLGRFGSAAVSLHWDNEDFPRCFLIVGPKARSTLRLSLEEEGIQMLIEALQQVVKDLPATSGG